MLVGRDAERRVLDGLVAGARLGRSGVLVLVGEAGIGKSTLLDYVAGRADDMRICRIAGAEAERDLPFGALGLVVGQVGADFEKLPPPQAAALRVALALDDGEPPDRFAVGAATLSLLARRAEQQPIALLLEDAHQFDRPSAEALVFAARRLLADRILLVAALRADEASPLRGADLPELELHGLAEPETRELLRGTAEGEVVGLDRSHWVHRVTGGNPLAILEVAREPGWLARDPVDLTGSRPVPVPAALSETFVRRARAVGPSTLQALALVEAAAGDLGLVLRAAPALGVGPADLAAAETAGLLVTSGNRVRFTHPLVGSSAYASLAPERRRATHAAVGGALPADDLARLAWHRAAAALGPDDSAAETLEGLGAESRRRGAYAVATSAYARSAGLTVLEIDRSRRFVEAADAAYHAGDSAWALRLLEEAGAAQLPIAVRSRAHTLRAAIATRSGSLEEAWTTLMNAARDVADENPRQALHLLAEAADVAFYRGDADLALEIAQVANGLVTRDTADRSGAIGHLALGIAEVLDGRDGTRSLREGARLLGGTTARPGDELDASWLTFAALFLRDKGETRRLLDAVESARASTSVGALPHVLFHLARDEATTDRWPAAVSDYTEAVALAEELGQSTEQAMSLAGLAWVEARQGAEEASLDHARRALEVAERRGVTMARIWAAFALADLDLALGRVDSALASFDALDSLITASRVRDVDWSPGPELVEVLLRTGNPVKAQSVAARHRERAEAKGGPWSLARAGRASGLLAADDNLDEVFGAALRLHEVTPDAYEKARTQLIYGTRLRRARRRVDARPVLQQAYDTFAALGARPWASAAADELAATGMSVARPGERGLDLLTPRERQIVSLLVQGRTTRSAASALFLSPKTVEYHLRHVYTKLGITSRRELAQMVGESGGQRGGQSVEDIE